MKYKSQKAAHFVHVYGGVALPGLFFLKAKNIQVILPQIILDCWLFYWLMYFLCFALVIILEFYLRVVYKIVCESVDIHVGLGTNLKNN